MNRREREEHRQREGRRWARAMAVRQTWEPSDHEEESARLEAEIAALLAAGAVVRCPARWADGATQSSRFDI
jgi:hypothetical protein